MDWQRFSNPTQNPKGDTYSSIANASQRRVRAYCNREFPGWTNKQHEDAARRYAKKADAAHNRYIDEAYKAIRKYGGHGNLVSGVVREHFPDTVKFRLRELRDQINTYTDASVVHWRCSGRRRSWQQEFR